MTIQPPRKKAGYTGAFSQPPVFVASRAQMVMRSFYRQRIWLPAVEASADLPSRVAWLDALTFIYEYEGYLFHRNGEEFTIPDVDDVFPDPDNRWMSDFLAADASGKAPAHYSRKYERLQLIELYCQLIKLDDLA